MAQKKNFDEAKDWEEILTLIKDDKFSEEFPDYTLEKKEYGYLIQKNTENIFLFTEKQEIKIYFDKSNYEQLQILSSKEIENFIKNKQKHIDELYVRKTEDLNYSDILEELGCYITDCELELREKKNLNPLELIEILSDKEDYKQKDYSKYFYKYFIYEDEKKEDEKILYQKNKTRKIISDNIKKLKLKKGLKTFKFTGPHSIGKSFTLLRISNVLYNVAYINLKALSKNKDLYESYSMIMHELKRFSLKNDKLDDLNKLIQKNYNENKLYLKLL